MPNPQFPAAPPLPRRIRKVGAPLALIIALGIVIGVLLLLITVANPVRGIVGFILSTAAMSVVLFAYLWLDRWEPEPRRLLVLAFCWGASVAVILAVILEAYGDYLLGAKPLYFNSMAILAPFVEEATKGLFLLIMMTGNRRNQLNSLTDCMVYAGVTGAGFAWLEDIMYAGQIPLFGDLFRDIIGPFAHPLFTTMTGIGVYFALQRRNVVAKAGCILLGYLAAVVMHGMWNGSMKLGHFIAVYLLWMVPVFVLVIVLAVLSRRKEQRIVAARLPDMVAANLITPNEATWMGSMRNRRQAIRAANSVDGRPAGKAVAKVAIAAVELAFLRDRIARGFSDHQMLALQAEEAEALVTARWTAPAAFANYRAY